MNQQRLYNLLPAIYKLRDKAEGEPLRALLAAMENELQLLEGDIDRLYENWFIETCDEWVVPYIGDLLDVEELYAENSRTYGQQQRRAYVANTIAYRRRKGTAPMLEQLTRDVTGWRAGAVEFFESLATTQNINHLRDNSIVSLKVSGKPELLGTPFEKQVAYSIDIRQAGKYNISNIGLFIWRLQSYPINKGTARMVNDASGRYYTFSPLGKDIPLFNQPQTETNIVHLASEINLPGKLRRLPLQKELDRISQESKAGKMPNGIGYFDRDAVLQVFINHQSVPIPPSEILIASLKDSESNDWLIPDADINNDFPTKVVAIDPESGRLAFLNDDIPNSVEVSYFYGFSGDIGAGSYQRYIDKTDFVKYNLPIPHSQLSNPLATTIENWNKSVQAWECLDANCVSLAEVVVGDAKIVQVESLVTKLKFTPGIIRGLNVVVSGNTEVTVKGGAAIDSQGRAIALSCGSEKIDLTRYSIANQVGILILSFFPAQDYLLKNRRDSEGAEKGKKEASVFLEREGGGWQISLIEETAIDGYPVGYFIVLAKLSFDTEGNINSCVESSLRTNFKPGIVTGLKVVIPRQTMTAIITAGIAVDARGQIITFNENIQVDLSSYQGKSELLLLLSYLGRKRGQVTLIENSQSGDYSEEVYLRLACLDIPEVEIEQINSKQILQVSNSTQAKLNVKSGKLVDGNENQIYLFDDCQLDLSAYPNRKLILFISNQKGLGLPLLTGIGQDWQKFGVVTPKPGLETTNLINIGDNASYHGDLTIIIPAETKLKIIAASGFRPHIRGNLFIKGVTGENSLPGELILEGLLIEGKVTVLPGNLKKLQIDYCTLVPQQGGLTVEAEIETVTIPESESPSEESLTLVAVVMYYLNVISSLNKNTDKTSSKQALNQLLQLAWEQANRVFDQLWDLINQPSSQPDDCLPDENLHLDSAIKNNSQLQIYINSSICGKIHLPNTIPNLNIKDSIIDSTETAIAAGQTTVNIDNTTVFGRTQARILSANNSIFTAKVTALLQQIGCLRFCYVPANSTTPRRYLCQPDEALAQEIDELPPRFTSLVVDSNQKLFLGTEKGVFSRNYDDADKWQAINQGLTNLNIKILVNHANNQIAGTANGGIFRLNDGEWQQVNPNSTNNTEITALLISENHIFAGTRGNGILHWKLINNQWIEVNSSLTNRKITTLASSDNQIYARSVAGGVFVSSDSGENWTQINLNLGKQYISALTIDINGNLYAATLNSGVFRFDSASKIWQPINSGLTILEITHLVASKTENRLIAATVGGKIFFRANGGDWEIQENIGLIDTDITALAIDNNNNNGNIFICTEIGNILRSYNRGISWKSINNGLKNIEQKLLILSRLQPRFTSTQYGNPGYAQLANTCAAEIRIGAEDGSEMGVFSYLKQPQRQANLQASLDEYLRFGLQAGIFYIS